MSIKSLSDKFLGIIHDDPDLLKEASEYSRKNARIPEGSVIGTDIPENSVQYDMYFVSYSEFVTKVMLRMARNDHPDRLE